jgi:hypothetical protein
VQISKKTFHEPDSSPEQVVGSSVVSEFQVKDGKQVLVRQPKIDFINDKAGKPVGIYEHIGQRPILAFGNSDSDMQMIEYTLAGEGRRMGLFVHHTDGDREYAYDRKSHVGTLDKALDQAAGEGWIIVDMKKDWKTVEYKQNKRYIYTRIEVPNISSHRKFNRNSGQTGQKRHRLRRPRHPPLRR